MYKSFRGAQGNVKFFDHDAQDSLAFLAPRGRGGGYVESPIESCFEKSVFVNYPYYNSIVKFFQYFQRSFAMKKMINIIEYE